MSSKYRTQWRVLFGALSVFVMLVAFQNFSPSDALKSPRYTKSFADQAEVDLWRRRVWAAKCGPELQWEVCYEGAGIPGSNQRSHLDWDNPIDDDWDEAAARELSWLVNTKSGVETVMRVDRTIDGYRHKTGHFWRRDEFITAASGFEAEFRVKILPHSQAHGVMLHYLDDRHAFRIEFGTHDIRFYTQLGGDVPVATQVRRNTSMTHFRLVKAPETGVVQLFAGDVRLFARFVLTPGPNRIFHPSTAERGLIVTRIGFGDNNNLYEGQKGGAYEIAFFRYRRAVHKALRRPPALPVLQVCRSSVSWKALHSQSQEAFETKMTSLRDVVPDVRPSIFGRTFKFAMKLDPNARSEDGFSFDYFDRLGGVILTVFPDRVEMKANTKPGVPAVAFPTDFSGYNLNQFRLVRSDNGLYWNLYLNENPVPVLVDVRSSGVSVNSPGLLWGPFKTPEFSQIAESGQNINARERTRGFAYVPRVSWLEQALAPADCQ